MIDPITQETIHLILPFKVSQLAVLYAKKFGINTRKALEEIYKSATYKELEREQSKLWHLGPVSLLEYISEHH